MQTIRATMAQALVRFLAQQQVERDGVAAPFFAGMFGIFGHGNVTGLGQALQEVGKLRFYRPAVGTRQCRRESSDSSRNRREPPCRKP